MVQVTMLNTSLATICIIVSGIAVGLIIETGSYSILPKGFL